MKKVTLESELQLREYLRFKFGDIYRKPINIFILFIGVGMLAMVVIYLFFGDSGFKGLPYSQLFISVFILFVSPILIYYTGVRAFKKKDRITERMKIIISEDLYEVYGTSFEAKMNWAKIHSVRETNDFFLIYSSKYIVNIISKKELQHAQIVEVREVLNNIPGLKRKLKRN